MSRGENKISLFLKKSNIDFEPQKRFDDCGNKRALSFDFYIKKQNTLIEYDGKQHFKPINLFGGESYLAYVRANDKIKNKFAADNKIRLIRIPYTEFKNIEKILQKELKLS